MKDRERAMIEKKYQKAKKAYHAEMKKPKPERVDLENKKIRMQTLQRWLKE